MFLTVNGEGHYCIITNITNTTVYLADTDLGILTMAIETFNSIYCIDALLGYALVITNDTSNTQLNEGIVLNVNETQNIKGKTFTTRTYNGKLIIGGSSSSYIRWNGPGRGITTQIKKPYVYYRVDVYKDVYFYRRNGDRIQKLKTRKLIKRYKVQYSLVYNNKPKIMFYDTRWSLGAKHYVYTRLN